MAKLKVYHGSMRAGKSNLLLTTKYNFNKIGKKVLAFSTIDNIIRSRTGQNSKAIHVGKEDSFKTIIINKKVDIILIDEAQFLTIDQVEELTDIVDDDNIEVYCYTLLTDYRAKLFIGTKRLLELADEIETIQSKTLCWCGRNGTHNMRVNSLGYPKIEGDIIEVGEGYEVLCRKHYREGITLQAKKDENREVKDEK